MEVIATGAAANISSQAAKGIFQSAKRHIRYVKHYQRYVKDFEVERQKLIEKRKSLQQDIDVAKRNGQTIKADVQGWCDRVDKIVAEEETRVNDLQVEASNNCFFGFCPNIKARHKLSRKAEEDAVTFDKLIKDCKFNSVGYRDVPQPIMLTGFETFKSREKVFNDVMESLKDSTVSMIGVHGMSGVGKTSLVNEVYRQALEAKSFDSVVMVTVSQTPDIQKIQDQIAESLGSKIEEKTTGVRAGRLRERLIKVKRVLIILDDIWKKLDLEQEVGIPFGSQHKGCRILLTSRDKNVLSTVMGATNTFQLGVLDDGEAWEFFKKMAGDSAESADLRPTAIEVTKSCAGLPLAIATVAKALRKQELPAWEEGLRQLQRPYSEQPSGISAEVYKAIELSFNHLQGEDLKQIFLLCSLLRGGRIEDLLRYAFGLGLINGANTLKEGRNKLLTMMNTLKESCMLLDSNTNDVSFDVHDLTYIVAKSIASRDNQVFALKEEDGSMDWPDDESMKNCNKICLIYPSIDRLPDQLICPQLFLFLLFSKDPSLALPDDFFTETTKLKVLDLTGMQFSCLPSSICLLTSLNTLCLDQCKLGDNIAIIGGLKSLKILSLLKSDIRILPEEIGQLVKLKSLDVSHCAKLKTISAGILSNLSRLEELYMGGTCIQWGQSSATFADLHGLSRLSTLEVQIPDALVAPQDFFQELLKLERFKIFIGKEWKWERLGSYQYSRTLKLSLNTGIANLDRGIKKLLKKTEDLHLDKLKGVKIALQDLTDEESLSHLKNLHIQNGLDTEYIINDEYEFPQLNSLTLHYLPKLVSFCPQHETGATSSFPQPELPLFSEKISFPYLEKLWLKSINVIRIWRNQLSSTSLRSYGKLTTLKIEGCGSLKHLLSYSMAKCLVNLTDFEIIECNCLKEIIFMEEIEEESQAAVTLSLFPQLKSLELKRLPQLIGFCSNYQNQVIKFPAMKSLEVSNCPELEGFVCRSSVEGICSQVLFDNKVAFTSLEGIRIDNMGKLKMIWENPVSPNSFPKLRDIRITGLPNLKYIWKNGPKDILSFKNLREITVWDCGRLKNVFPASVARDLPQLSELRITDCGVEEIVSKVEEGPDSETTVTFEFDQLSTLELVRLPDCKWFYPGRHTTKWPMLKELAVSECGEMKIFGTQLITHHQQLDSPPPLFLLEKAMPNLQRLTLHIDYIAMTSGGQLPSCLFHQIKSFTVEHNFSKSDHDFQISFLESFYNLEELSMVCCEIKELFCTEADTGNKGTCATTLSTVRKLELEHLHNLKHYLWKQDVQVDRILPNLETLQVHNCWNLMSLGSSSASFQNLITLKVWNCEGMKYLDTCLAVRGLSQLKKLIIEECISLKEIVGNEEDEATYDIVFSRLKSLEFVTLPRLKSFCSGDHSFGFPCLEQVIVKGCPELETFCKGVLNAPLLQSVEDGKGKGHWSGDLDSTLHSTKIGYQGIEYLILSEFSKSMEIWKEKSVDLKKLRVLEVKQCNCLKYIFSVSLALVLVQLRELRVKNCPMMEYIIMKEADETVMDTVRLPVLWTISLSSCSELKSFCRGNVTLQCPYLMDIRVDDCPKMHAMACTREIGGGEKTPFFTDKVSCANLRWFKLSSTNIHKLWPDKPHSSTPSNVQNLKSLDVRDCHNLEYLFPSFLIKKLEQFSDLRLYDCENMEHVIFTEEEGITEDYLFTELKELELIRLPKLGTFCHGDRSEMDEAALFNEKVLFPNLNRLTIQGIGKCRKIWHDKPSMNSFDELTTLWVKNCEGLSNILPFSMVRRLEKIETLGIDECMSVEEIIRPDDNHKLDSNESHAIISAQSMELDSTTKFVFPKMRKLYLRRLPKLMGFHSKEHTTEWPSLKELKVSYCCNLETLAREYINFGESQPLISVQQPLFWVTKEPFPSLEELILIQNGNMKEIWHEALPNKYFLNLRRLELTGFLGGSVTIPNCFLQSLQNLENLSIGKAAFNELFPCERLGDEDEHAGTLAHLKELRLSELPELTHLWKKEASLAQVLCNLKFLQVMECSKLKNLVPSSVSFKRLTTLDVSKCHGFRNLVTFTVAKSMVQLKKMSVTDCQMIEEIIASTIEEVMDGIVFSQLKSLELDRLPNLSRFCTGNYTIVFPSLEEVILRQCPKMELFTKGKLSTPKLHGLQSTKGEYVGLWQGDLNAVIQQLFVEKAFPSLEDLELSSINIQRAWKHKPLTTLSYAQNLTCLTIRGCHNLNCLFSLSMVKSFVHLKKLNVENCENVENVIFVEGLAEEMMNQKLFRVLEFLLLKDLPKLTRFCHGNYFEFPLLTSLIIESCPTLRTFVSGAKGINSEITSPTLFNENVAFPCLEELTIKGVGNWRKIWKKQPTNCAVHIEEFQIRDTY